MEWISVRDRLPEVPSGKYGVQVLVVTRDPMYGELTNTNGFSVVAASFGKVDWSKDLDFYTLHIGNTTLFGPMGDKVEYWMYFPEPPSLTKQSTFNTWVETIIESNFISDYLGTCKVVSYTSLENCIDTEEFNIIKSLNTEILNTVYSSEETIVFGTFKSVKYVLIKKDYIFQLLKARETENGYL